MKGKGHAFQAEIYTCYIKVVLSVLIECFKLF